MQHLVSKEVDHRLKNLMATINGLISMLQKHATTPRELADQLRQRVNALSNSIGLLRGAVEGETDLDEKGHSFGTGASGPVGPQRLTLEGPEVTISSNGFIPPESDPA